ncbi:MULTISPECIES: DUF3576 domain-containing protein [Halocynthiibacter]|uniref:DUF3576 domain-containing protein n=1 Tax=Halocynthiibacter halioticoli TaxID=2986804 RepID=A0AAE3J0W3_9RHOB|nr:MULTISPECIES: DUF3576 domain-containing protein [Halocynthiibacter]MCV6825700.1 DUF3576 domain-containing protein [Halocynthiibacter halioticoli]MCW4058701.1 DUF3576 domain-containing protein [Halocynthiibacter sp. SDUM655004]MDE0591074.1 DUF3576 domain-containing protein [Halocynthiibacter sp. C4]
MAFTRVTRLALALSTASLLSACSLPPSAEIVDDDPNQIGGTGESIWDIFGNARDPNVTIEVNKYIWNAALEVLNFLPIQEVDPFSGVFITGYGVPPGGSQSYRAAVFVQDPALDARSLVVALQRSGGRPVSAETQRAVEDAILSRARQLRISDSNL